MDSAEVRSSLLDALRLDLVGPGLGLGDSLEVLNQFPSRWYMTGFLVPTEANEEQKIDDDGDDEMEDAGDTGGADDTIEPDKPAARRASFPSSIGVSLLVSAQTQSLDIVVRWGDYKLQLPDADVGYSPWIRKDRKETVSIELPVGKKRWQKTFEVPRSLGLEIVVAVRSVEGDAIAGNLPSGTRSVSLFLVNRRTPSPDDTRDEAFAFQAAMQISSDQPLVPRPDLRSAENEWDMQVADLQYRDAFEFAVGHSISTYAEVEDGSCSVVRTSWIPEAEVDKVSPTIIDGVELRMDNLALIRDFDDAQEKLSGFVLAYRQWIQDQRSQLDGLNEKRSEVAEALLARAGVAANRIEKGISLLENKDVHKAFCIANRAMAAQAKKRLATQWNVPEKTVIPEWRPFQLAFVLMNMEGIVDPKSADRQVVDLLFFPTGGGKTEAYLGLAAFTLVLRRLKNPGISSAGLSVLMRYTLRLLTLDQLGRAAALICALELEREKDVVTLGEWPFEVALWVGRAATPNFMGKIGDGSKDSARAKTIAHKNDDRKPSPIPIESCPWCGTKFTKHSFTLKPNPDYPTDLRVHCMNRHCDFSGASKRHLPIVSVDDPIYRRLPCFMIATVDKFAAMPWTGEVGKFFGKVQRYDEKVGFYGPCSPGIGHPLPSGELLPPDLIIQDELHLISGPLGTVAGLYETALDELSHREIDGKRIGPKIVASTATVRRAESQIRALFNRSEVDIFPPPGPDRRDSFFAQTDDPSISNARLYTAIAAPGRSSKKIYLKAQLCLMAAAAKQYRLHKNDDPDKPRPADPYMTVLGYFNSLRELGGARRIVEDEVTNALLGYASRKRVGEDEGLFINRKLKSDVVELTSRVSTAKVAESKLRLESEFGQKEPKPVDVALATNMISVGLDITRLGLMLVFGQPKTSSEYIQSTSRVGRDEKRPGLVVTVLNLNRPRDRSHYERFAAYHESFYRHVEATSVTPFSPRAMDRALAGTLVALARHGNPNMTPPLGAQEILTERPTLDFAVDVLATRAENHMKFDDPDDANHLRARVRQRCLDLLDEWSKIVDDYRDKGVSTQYQREVGSAKQLLYEFLNPDLVGLHERHSKFRANRSMRDVEPEVNLWLRNLDNVPLESQDERNG
ncbi:hypothetical protein CA13_19070 [Planctomycetes bacterium CA13]|uniref:Helicase C-terminal domain-containing protein n=1 Tax=Novipirellula herctigrandis TaxID=2527986 RepID=A0A5C5YZF3_9BACT|nr:hypothetical protein CA13_19070 [Planctomycetes bacterium CA13]